MLGFFTTEATIKIKHFRREELILMEEHMLLATVADGQTATSCSPESAFGWVLIGWALGRSLNHVGPQQRSSPKTPKKCQELHTQDPSKIHTTQTQAILRRAVCAAFWSNFSEVPGVGPQCLASGNLHLKATSEKFSGKF